MGGYAFFCEFAPIFPSLALRFLLESTLLFCQFLSKCQSLLVIFYITRKRKEFGGPRCKLQSSEFHIVLLKKSAQAFFFCRSKYSLVVLAMTPDRASKATMFGMAMRPFLWNFVHYFSYFLLGTSEKCRLVSLTTTPDRANRAIRLGMAMRPLRVSAMAQARSSFMVAPTKMTTRKRI